MVEQTSASVVKNSACSAGGKVSSGMQSWRPESLIATGSPRPIRENPIVSNSELTQAGHRRLRISVACETCRKKKLKCDAVKPACSICVRKKITCQYAATGRRRRDPSVLISAGPRSDQSTSQSPRLVSAGASHDQDLAVRNLTGSRDGQSNADQQSIPSRLASLSDVEEIPGRVVAGDSQGTGSVLDSQPLSTPVGQELLPYIDSLLENVHPISCNNFLHPGSLCEAIHRAPHLLVLAICGSSAKFMPGEDSKSNGRRWAEEAKILVMKSLDRVSTLTMSAIQFLALHEMHEAEYTSAWNLIGTFAIRGFIVETDCVGIATRMSLQLRLHELVSPGTFLQQECRRRLMWAVFVSDLLFDCEKSNINPDLLLDLPLPCNLWSFTQGLPCKTLTLRQLRGRVEDAAIKQSSNHCAYLINIIMIRRKVLK
jgi:hypothetical protein